MLHMRQTPLTSSMKQVSHVKPWMRNLSREASLGKACLAKCNMEIVMIDKTTAALAAILVFASAVTASAQPMQASRMRAPAVRAYECEPPQGSAAYCYLPSEPCDNEHMLTN
jgi:hypothetical protein